MDDLRRNSVFDDVRMFMSTGRQLLPVKPAVPADDIKALRLRLLDEEYAELRAAVERDDLVEVADGCADLIYVTAGLALSYGLPIHSVWREVQTTNMAKFPNGRPLLNEHGKIIKPPDWKPPDIARILSVFGAEAQEKTP